MTAMELLRAFGLGTVAAVAAGFDLRYRRIPDSLIAAGLIVEVASTPGLTTTIRGGMCAFLLLSLVRLVSGFRLGRGDVKYGLYLGAALGPKRWWYAAIIASCAALLYAALRGRTKGEADGSLPFGPFLSAGALCSEAIPFLLSSCFAGAVS